jgi:hypothetical protein
MSTEIDRSPRAVLDELAKHPRGEALARLVHALAVSAFDERRSELPEGIDEAARQLELDESSAETSFGNVLRALRKGRAMSAPERTLLGALTVRAIASAPPADASATTRCAEMLAWLAAHTPFDPLAAIDDALVEGAGAIWSALGGLVCAHDGDASGSIDRPSAIVAASALASARSPEAVAACERTGSEVRDPLLRRLLGRGSSAGDGLAPIVVISAEQIAPPRHPLVTLLLVVSLVLPVVALAKLFARVALKLHSPAEVTVSRDNVRVLARTELLGRTLREREILLPTSGLARVAREARWPAASLYAGLIALVLGSFVGLRLVLDGARGGSPEFVALGAIFLVVGLVVDYALAMRPSRSPERSGLAFEPRRGPTVALRDADSKLVDAALRRLST